MPIVFKNHKRIVQHIANRIWKNVNLTEVQQYIANIERRQNYRWETISSTEDLLC